MQCTPRSFPQVDVAVIGAGFAGIMAARTLRTGGVTVALLEAQDQVGGRVRSVHPADGFTYEEGGQFFNQNMTQLLELIAAQRLTTCEVHHGKRSLSISQGRVQPTLADGILSQDLLDRLSATAPDAFASMDDWLIAQEEGQALLALRRSAIEELWSRNPAELSFASIQSGIASGSESSESDFEMFCPEGLGTLANRLAEEIADSLHLNSPVASVQRTTAGFDLGLPMTTIRATRLVFAASPSVLNTIHWTAPQDRWLNDLHSQFARGQMRKIVLRYETPFWRDLGFDCIVQFDDPTGVSVIDTSPAAGGTGFLTVFVGGRTAAKWSALADEAVLKKVFDLLEPICGAAVRHPLTVIQTDWTDHPWVGGGYNASPRPWTDEDPLIRLTMDHGGLYFAGAEIADRCRGYIEGAIHSGAAVAQSILAVVAQEAVRSSCR
jgi:monoamine oxidase